MGQPELQDPDNRLSWEKGLRLLSWKSGKGVPPATRGGGQGLRLPDLGWKLKSPEQFIETPSELWRTFSAQDAEMI